MEPLVWRVLVWATRWWATRYMDQWEKFRFETPSGPVYVSLTLESQWPESFDAIDRAGRPVRPLTP